jgi:cell division protein FtsB
MDARKSLDFDANLRENTIIDLKIQIQKLENENNALKTKMTLMYSNWHYDFQKYDALKEKCRKNVNSEVDNLNMDLSTFK